MNALIHKAPLRTAILDSFNPLLLPDNEGIYSLEGAAGESTYITAGGLIPVVADRSGLSSVNGLVLNGVAGNYASVPDAPALDITGDIEIISEVALNSATPPGSQAICSRYTPVGDERMFIFAIAATTGRPRLSWFTDGTSGSEVSATATAAPTASSFQDTFLRVTLDVDDGAGGNVANFYEGASPSGPWTPIGNPVVGAGTTSIHAGTSILEVGSITGGASQLLAGISRRVIIKDGIDGTTVLDIDFTAQSKTYTTGSGNTFLAETGQTVTVVSTGDTGARIGGARDLVQLTVAKQAAFVGIFSDTEESVSAGENGYAVAWGTFASTASTITASDTTESKTNIRTKMAVSLQKGVRYRISFTPTATEVTVNSLGAGIDYSVGEVLSTSITSGVLNEFTYQPIASYTHLILTCATSANDVAHELSVVGMSVTRLASEVPYAYLDGSDDYLKTAPFPLVQPLSRYSGISQVTYTADEYLLDGNGAFTQSLRTPAGASAPRLQVFSGAAGPVNDSLAVGALGVVRELFNGAASSIGINLGAAVIGDAGTTNADGFTVGSTGLGNSRWSNITFSFALLRSVADSASPALRIARWCIRRFKITP